jgi:hypothetical protein
MLVSKADLTSYLRVSPTGAEDALLGTIAASVNDYFLNECGRIIESASVTEIRDGNSKTQMKLRESPVTAVTSLTVDGQAIPARASVTGAGYVFTSSGLVKLVGYSLTDGVQNVVIVYTAGFATVPNDIKQALQETGAFIYRNRERLGEISKNIEGAVVQYVRDESLPMFRKIVENYKKVSLVA